jgi:hypothetical protein
MKSLGPRDNLLGEHNLLFNGKFKTLLGIFCFIGEMLLPSPGHILKSTGFKVQ